MDSAATDATGPKFQDDLLDAFQLEVSSISDTVIKHVNGRELETWTRAARPLGVGGFGTAWLWKDRNGGSRVVKEVKKATPNTEVLYWKREISAMALLSRNTFDFPQFYGWFEDEANVYIAMEHCQLGDLWHYVQAPLAEDQARLVTGQISKALEVIHNRGITHRDLKPTNILVRRGSPDWQVAVADFGISKRVRNLDTTLYTSVQGLFAAPEMQGVSIAGVEQSFDYTNAVDLWSLGCVAYWLLTHDLPLTIGKLLTYCRLPSSKCPELISWNQVDAQARDFVSSLLKPVPADRLTALEASQHPWLSEQLQIKQQMPDELMVAQATQEVGTNHSEVSAQISLPNTKYKKAYVEDTVEDSFWSKTTSYGAQQEPQNTSQDVTPLPDRNNTKPGPTDSHASSTYSHLDRTRTPYQTFSGERTHIRDRTNVGNEGFAAESLKKKADLWILPTRKVNEVQGSEPNNESPRSNSNDVHRKVSFSPTPEGMKRRDFRGTQPSQKSKDYSYYKRRERENNSSVLSAVQNLERTPSESNSKSAGRAHDQHGALSASPIRPRADKIPQRPIVIRDEPIIIRDEPIVIRERSQNLENDDVVSKQESSNRGHHYGRRDRNKDSYYNDYYDGGYHAADPPDEEYFYERKIRERKDTGSGDKAQQDRKRPNLAAAALARVAAASLIDDPGRGRQSQTTTSPPYNDSSDRLARKQRIDHSPPSVASTSYTKPIEDLNHESTVYCPACDGSRIVNGSIETCRSCAGAGGTPTVRQTGQTIRRVWKVCPICGGDGDVKVCNGCNGSGTQNVVIQSGSTADRSQLKCLSCQGIACERIIHSRTCKSSSRHGGYSSSEDSETYLSRNDPSEKKKSRRSRNPPAVYRPRGYESDDSMVYIRKENDKVSPSAGGLLGVAAAALGLYRRHSSNKQGSR